MLIRIREPGDPTCHLMVATAVAIADAIPASWRPGPVDHDLQSAAPMVGRYFAAGSVLVLALTTACDQSDFGDIPVDTLPEVPEGPGDPAWGDPDLTCTTTSDCAPSETCMDGMCQMKRCSDGPYESAAPLGAQHYFFADHEIVVADGEPYQGSYWIDGYKPEGAALGYAGGSWKQSAAPILDIAGGNLLGSRPQLYATIRQGASNVFIARSGLTTLALPVGFQPVAVAAGDVDLDGVDEVIAIAADNRAAVCDAVEQTCTGYTFQAGVAGVDVAAADVDGDGHAEVILLVTYDGHTELLAWNINHEASGEQAIVGAAIDREYLAIDAGDGDGDGVAEVYALIDGGWLGLASDRIELWRLGAASQQIGSVDVDRHSRDLTTADLDMDGRSAVLVLHDDRSVTRYRQQGSSLTQAGSGELSVSQSPLRIAAADFDGDSPSARRVGNAELVAGEIVPSMVLFFPPYSRTFSDGVSNIFVGDGDTTAESFTDTVSLRAAIEVGVGAEFPGGVLGAEVSARLQKHFSASRTLSTQKYVGTRFYVEPDIELHGSEYGMVVLSCACFHAYRYEVEDPAGRIGGNGGELVVVVPVGGRTTLWSTPRYNALAEALGDLPIIEHVPEIGSLEAYPSSPAKPDGTPLRPEDLAFPNAPSFLVSDAGRAGWWLSVIDTETNAAALETEIGVSSSIKIAGVKFGGEVAAGFGKGYSLTVGREALFGGAVPSLPDLPSTPEDEYDANAYTFRPLVYRERYRNAAGEDSGYYVLSYSVGQ